MKMPTITYEHSGVSEQQLAAYEYHLLNEITRVQEAAKEFYESDYASINLPMDRQHLRQAQRLAARYRRVSLLIVVGIGGSNLGTMAVQEAVLGKLHNLDPGKRPRVLYADTVDPESMARVDRLLDAELKAGKRVLVNLISKSGGTTETVANYEILLETLRKHKRKPADSVVVTTDEGSHLWSFAKQQRLQTLPMPKKVGGRYSVLSPVGLFPLAVLGIDIQKLMDGAAHMRAQCLKTGHLENPAAVRAAMLAHARQSGKRIADNLYFKTDFESVGKWYRQLMGESVGKEWDRDHTRQVYMGITPTVSVGSTDLHSMAQLYFGGPNDKFFSIVTIGRWRDDPAVPDMREYDALVPNIQRRKLSVIMRAISDSVMMTLAQGGRPFCGIALPDASEESVGALLQLHMFEMIYLAALLDVNPFDQPNVEAYKIETKRILARKNVGV